VTVQLDIRLIRHHSSRWEKSSSSGPERASRSGAAARPGRR
jgi:hypothetical protein